MPNIKLNLTFKFCISNVEHQTKSNIQIKYQTKSHIQNWNVRFSLIFDIQHSKYECEIQFDIRFE